MTESGKPGQPGDGKLEEYASTIEALPDSVSSLGSELLWLYSKGLAGAHIIEADSEAESERNGPAQNWSTVGRVPPKVDVWLTLSTGPRAR